MATLGGRVLCVAIIVATCAGVTTAQACTSTAWNALGFFRCASEGGSE
jgi:hypothetical protein